ncbi:helix-turn-helix domain-containing protein [Nocardia vinacea]|uniref:helix-turn-helix domain-containing protein n=1 Tax=Nocardia vinacea TaxID=96468 RepID=UPI002E0F013F|nr:helix-turn-helix domain-containing protein [Nocardia vinacea]
MSEDGPSLARRQLGKYLRNGRQERGLTLHEAARLIQRSGSTLHRMEKGQVAELREIDIEALCTIYEFDADHTAAMKALAVQGNELGWWYEYVDLLPKNFDFYVGLEASAQRLKTYEPELVPGLLQTPAYASVLIRSGFPDDDADEHARRVRLRMRRQTRITRKYLPASLDVILRESVLRGMVGGSNVMATQMRHLADMTTRPNVNLQILPFSAGFPVGVAVGPFVILEFGTDKDGQPVDPPVVYTENFTGGLYLAKSTTVQRYDHTYESLRRSAMDAPASRALLRQMAKEYA